MRQLIFCIENIPDMREYVMNNLVYLTVNDNLQ